MTCAGNTKKTSLDPTIVQFRSFLGRNYHLNLNLNKCVFEASSHAMSVYYTLNHILHFDISLCAFHFFGVDF